MAAPEKQRVTYEKSFPLPGNHTVQVSLTQLPPSYCARLCAGRFITSFTAPSASAPLALKARIGRCAASTPYCIPARLDSS